MAYTNSSLATYKNLSSHHSGTRTHSIDRITPHCIVGMWTAKQTADYFATTDREASCNYGIGKDGDISLCVEEKNRSWCSSSNANDQRAVTIECASDTKDPYTMTDATYAALIKLCADICKRNGKSKLIWLADKDKTLNYAPASDEMVLTVHRWFANKSCPGKWLYSCLGDLAKKVTAALGSTTSTGLQATAFKDLTEKQAVEKISPLCTADMKTSGILASVMAAQFILESGYGKSELAQNANNVFGMKKSLSGNTWSDSTWDGTSVYTKQTKEQNADGSYETITADFRKYSCVEDSIADHSAYLLGAKNGKKLRYKGIAGMTDYKAVAQLIKDGGYATSLTYVENLCSIIEKWNLTQYDDASASTDTSTDTDTSTGNDTVTAFPAVPFTVRVLIDDLNYRSKASMSGTVKGQTGKGVFTITKVSNGWGKLKSGAGWIWLENPSYVTVLETVSSDNIGASSSGMTNADCPFTVKVSIPNLTIRRGSGTNYSVTGQYTGIGVFTIVEVASGRGSAKGWGKLKSGAGWIALDHVERT